MHRCKPLHNYLAVSICYLCKDHHNLAVLQELSGLLLYSTWLPIYYFCIIIVQCPEGKGGNKYFMFQMIYVHKDLVTHCAYSRFSP